MKKKLFILILTLVVACLFAIPVSAETQNGWVEEYDTWYYYEDGVKITDCIKEIDGDFYAFGSDGYKFEEPGLHYIYMENADPQRDTVIFYITEDNGKLLANTWKETKHTYDEELSYFYFGEGGFAYREGLYEIDGAKYYFDSEGRMETGFIYNWDSETETQTLYYADENGRVFESQWFYTSRYDDAEPEWFYASADGSLLIDGIYQVNGYYYFFDYYGELCSGFIYGDDGALYYADPNDDSRIKTSTWFQARRYGYWDELTWFYATADGSLYCNTVENIGGTLYGFYASGVMADDEFLTIEYWDEELGEHVVVGHYRARVGGALYANEWYETRYGAWYYYTADGKAATGLVNIGGVNYFFFEYDGEMLADDYIYYHEEGDTERVLIADKDGAITECSNNDWTYVDGYWYYVQDETLCSEGIYEINGKKYGFGHRGRMHENGAFSISIYDEDTGDYLYEKYYFAKADGSLAENEWCCENSEYSDYTWWYYAGSDGALLKDGLYTIGGKEYWFGMDSSLIADAIYYEGDVKLYICKLNEDGSGGYVVRTEGWYTCEGTWIYVNADGYVHEGWLNDQYFLDPAMYFGSYIIMPNFEDAEDPYVELYLFNKNGTAEKITADGFYSAQAPYSYGTYTVYVRDGEIVLGDWVNANGNWYYFDEECAMVADDSRIIDEVPYFFDSNGVMADDGWIRSSDGTWYYAYPNGSLFTGIDSSNYLFDELGALIVNDFHTTSDGVIYYTDGNGVIIHTVINGWNEINGYRYYFEDGEITNDCTKIIEDVRYAFDYDGRMITNREFYGYLFGADGKQIENGWVQLNGSWYYTDEYGLYYSGIYEIDGKEYYFKNNILQQNATFFSYRDDAIITTDSEGVVLSVTPANGWMYSVSDDSYAMGTVYYYKDGTPFDGWVGPYYIEYGRMATDSVIEWKDSFYYLDKKGAYVSGGWYERDMDRWIYARNDGSLYYDEWLQYNGAWYYFDGSIMAADTILYIDGEYHSFNKDGVWLGEVHQDLDNLPDGWFYYQNAWYYINATMPVRECELYIDGAWYAFNYDGTMVENRVYGNYYYLDGGKRAEYTGWVKFDKGWSYFNEDHSVAYGWVKDGNQYYFLDYTYDYDLATDKYYMYLTTVENDYRVVDGKLYYFDASGALQYEATDNGWYQANGEWYCITNGEACYGDIYKIGNVYYAFDSDGRMIHNDTYDDKFFDESGAMVTTAGWYYIDTEYMEGWIYILADGRMATDGIFLIDGKEYSFYNFLWVE